MSSRDPKTNVKAKNSADLAQKTIASSKARASLLGIRQWQRRSRGLQRGERNLRYVISEIDRLTLTLGLPGETREEASRIYREAANKRLTCGRTLDATIGAAVTLACRLTRVPRQMSEIAAFLDTDENRVFKSYRVLVRGLNCRVPPPDPAMRLSEVCDRLGVSSETRRLAQKIMKLAHEAHLVAGRDPWGLAGAALYIAARHELQRIPQRRIADVCGVTEVTIRNRYKDLEENLDLESIRTRFDSQTTLS